MRQRLSLSLSLSSYLPRRAHAQRRGGRSVWPAGWGGRCAGSWTWLRASVSAFFERKRSVRDGRGWPGARAATFSSPPPLLLSSFLPPLPIQRQGTMADVADVAAPAEQEVVIGEWVGGKKGVPGPRARAPSGRGEDAPSRMNTLLAGGEGGGGWGGARWRKGVAPPARPPGQGAAVLARGPARRVRGLPLHALACRSRRGDPLAGRVWRRAFGPRRPPPPPRRSPPLSSPPGAPLNLTLSPLLLPSPPAASPPPRLPWQASAASSATWPGGRPGRT